MFSLIFLVTLMPCSGSTFTFMWNTRKCTTSGAKEGSKEYENIRMFFFLSVSLRVFPCQHHLQLVTLTLILWAAKKRIRENWIKLVCLFESDYSMPGNKLRMFLLVKRVKYRFTGIALKSAFRKQGFKEYKLQYGTLPLSSKHFKANIFMTNGCIWVWRGSN